MEINLIFCNSVVIFKFNLEFSCVCFLNTCVCKSYLFCLCFSDVFDCRIGNVDAGDFLFKFQHGSGLCVDFAVIFRLVKIKFNIVNSNAVIIIKFADYKSGLFGGYSGFFKSYLFCFCITDIVCGESGCCAYTNAKQAGEDYGYDFLGKFHEFGSFLF